MHVRVGYRFAQRDLNLTPYTGHMGQSMKREYRCASERSRGGLQART